MYCFYRTRAGKLRLNEIKHSLFTGSTSPSVALLQISFAERWTSWRTLKLQTAQFCTTYLTVFTLVNMSWKPKTPATFLNQITFMPGPHFRFTISSPAFDFAVPLAVAFPAGDRDHVTATLCCWVLPFAAIGRNAEDRLVPEPHSGSTSRDAKVAYGKSHPNTQQCTWKLSTEKGSYTAKIHMWLCRVATSIPPLWISLTTATGMNSCEDQRQKEHYTFSNILSNFLLDLKSKGSRSKPPWTGHHRHFKELLAFFRFTEC